MRLHLHLLPAPHHNPPSFTPLTSLSLFHSHLPLPCYNLIAASAGKWRARALHFVYLLMGQSCEIARRVIRFILHLPALMPTLAHRFSRGIVQGKGGKRVSSRIVSPRRLSALSRGSQAWECSEWDSISCKHIPSFASVFGSLLVPHNLRASFFPTEHIRPSGKWISAC